MLIKIMKVGVPHIAGSILPPVCMSEHAFIRLVEEAVTEKIGQEPESFFDSLNFWEMDRFPGETLFGILDKDTFTPIIIEGREPFEYPSLKSMIITYRDLSLKKG